MRDKNLDWDDQYDYSPNELAELSIRNRQKYEKVVNSNLSEGDSIEKWEERNRERAQEYLRQQRSGR